MRLGEVLDRTDEATDDEQPRSRRRTRLWVGLWLCVGLAAMSWAHGPVLLFPQADEAIVLYTPPSLGLIGPPTRTVVDASFVVRLPLVQRAARIDTAARPVTVEASVVADGVGLRLVGGQIHHRVRPADADAVVRRLGTAPAVRDALVADLAHATYAEGVGRLRVGELTDPERIIAALDEAGRTLADRAAQYGLETRVETRPAAEVDPAVAGTLARIAEIEDRLAARRGHATESEADRRDDRLAQARRHRDALAQVQTELTARLADAEARAAEARVEGEQLHAGHLAAARAEAAALVAEAAALRTEGEVEAARVRAGVAAIGGDGARLLDHVIATEVMPQLAHIRTGLPAPVPIEPSPAPLLPGPARVAIEPARDEPRGEPSPAPTRESPREEVERSSPPAGEAP